MSILKKKADRGAIQYPETLVNEMRRGFTAKVLEGRFGEDKKESSTNLKAYFTENDDDFDINDHVEGSSLHCEFGRVTLANRKGYDVDTDRLGEMIEEGLLTMHTVLNLIDFSRSAKKIQEVLGEKKFKEVATERVSKGESLSFYPNADFKSSIDEAFDASGVSETEPAPAPKKPKTKAKVSSLDKVKAARAKTKKGESDEVKTTNPKEAEEDLDQILAD